MTLGVEDWEFWISMLKEKGEVVQLPFVGFFYRIQKKSRRKSERTAVDLFLFQSNAQRLHLPTPELNGPIRKRKTWPKPINTCYRFLGIPV